MKNSKRIAIKEPDIFDILSAIWILASNEENEIMTYEGIREKLNLSNDYKIKDLILSRAELFTNDIPEASFQEWKDEIRSGYHSPTWISNIADNGERLNAIRDIKADDVFRSQFRAGKDAPQSQIEIIDWGLEHIDRLRKASIEAQDQSVKRWEIWLVFGVGILNIIATVVAAWLTK